MEKLFIRAGTTSRDISIFIQDSSAETEAGLTGLTYATANLVAYYHRQGASSAVSVALVNKTLGTWVAGGFKQIDATHMPGMYEFGIPDAALAAGADNVTIMLMGAANMVTVVIEIELTAAVYSPIAESSNILTPEEAAAVLRVDATDADMLALLSLVDRYIINATGRNWAADDPIRSEAKAAARILLVQWHENPGMLSSGMSSLDVGLQAALLQLEAIALRTKRIRFRGNNGAGGCTCEDAEIGDTVESVVGLVGVSGSQASNFESVITLKGEIQQSATGDLSEYEYLVYLVNPEDEMEYPG